MIYPPPPLVTAFIIPFAKIKMEKVPALIKSSRVTRHSVTSMRKSVTPEGAFPINHLPLNINHNPMACFLQHDLWERKYGMESIAKWFKTERILLLLVLGMQAAILIRLTPRREPVGQEPSQPGQEEIGTIPAPGAFVAATSRTTMVHFPSPRIQGNSVLSPTRLIFDEMDAFFERAISDFERMEAVFDPHRDWDAIPASPAMDMREHEDSYVVLFSLPGLNSSDVEVSLEGRLLSIVTVFNHPAYRDPYGHPATLRRRVRFPGPVADADMAKAFVTNGILTISVPKSYNEPSAHRTRLF
jgi:HSP20 family molecular chaperone IbpA